MTNKTSKLLRITEEVNSDLGEFRCVLDKLRELEPTFPSNSTAIEFLLWWWEQNPPGEVSPRKFRTKIRRGRPALGNERQPLAPSRAREGLGLDPVVQRRKLR